MYYLYNINVFTFRYVGASAIDEWKGGVKILNSLCMQYSKRGEENWYVSLSKHFNDIFIVSYIDCVNVENLLYILYYMYTLCVTSRRQFFFLSNKKDLLHSL